MRPLLTVVTGVVLGLCPALVVLATGADAPPATAPAAPDAAAEEVEDIEEIEEVEVAEPAAAATTEEALGLPQVFGRMHSATVHLPIGWLLMVLLMDFAALLLKRDSFREVGFVVLIATVASFAPSIASGLLRETQFPEGSRPEQLAELHRNLIFVMAGITVTALAIRAWARNRLRGATLGVYMLLVTGAVAVIAVAGHFGGRIVFGEDFLPF